MTEFINDKSDESEHGRPNHSGSEESSILGQVSDEFDEDEVTESESDALGRVKRGITLMFDSQSENENKEESPPSPSISSANIVNDPEVSAPVKKRNIAVIMDSDSE